ALGAGETTLLRMVGAYAMFDNGGRKVQPTVVDRIQDRYGHTIYRHDQRECRGCDAGKWENQSEPTMVDRRERVLDPMTAYQVALADRPAVPFRVPPGIKLIRVDVRTGMRAGPGASSVILEAFKPGTAPPDNYSVIGVADPEGRPAGVTPEADRMVRSGNGLY